jgi:hypothetical protein
MSQAAMNHPIVVSTDASSKTVSSLRSYLPVAVALIGAFLLAGWRVSVGGSHFITDSALMMLALASYCFAAVF